MEIVEGVIGGMVAGVIFTHWWCAIDIRYWREISDIRKRGMDELRDLCVRSEALRQEAIGLAEQAADKYLTAQEANNALRALLAQRVCPTPPVPPTDADLARGVEIARRLGHTIDDAVEWRLSNIEAQLKAQEGEL